MKLKNQILAFSLVALAITSCKKDKPVVVDPNEVIIANGGTLTGSFKAGQKVVVNQGTIFLKGYTYFEEGSTLTIAAGTIIKSDVAEKGALIMERGSFITAEGTSTSPIVFTSGKAVGERNPGDWGGIILLGKATTNHASEPTIEGGVGRKYGGTNNSDNSGILKFVRIEFAGIAASPGSEINGLTLGGVGSGTTLDYIQVTYGNDDAYEFFGGTVNAKHLIAYGTADDDFDFDNGYSGKIQFGFALRNSQFVDAGDAGNGVECDNDATGTAALPRTMPNLSNLTILGPNGEAGTAANHNFANRWRRNATFILNNSILLGHQKGGLSIESQGTYDAFINGPSEFKNNLLFAITAPFRFGFTNAADATQEQKDANAADALTKGLAIKSRAEANGTVLLASSAAANLTAAFNLTAPNLIPVSGVALTGAAFTGLQTDAFFEKVAYRGAFGSTNWANGWTSFNFPKGASGY